MRGRTTIVLLVIFAALLVYVLRYEKDKPSTEEQLATADVLLEVSPKFTNLIRLVADRDTVELRCRDDRRWHIVRPVLDRADDSMVQGLLAGVDPLRAEKRQGASRADQVAFALDRPLVVATFSQPKGSGLLEQTLRVGRRNPAYKTYYAIVDDDTSRAGLIESQLVERYLIRSAADYRYRRIDDFDITVTEKLGVETAAGRVLLARNDDREWEIVSPVRADADQAAVNELIKRLLGQRIKDFVDEAPENLAAYGLDPPQVTVQVVLENGITTLFEIGADADSAGEASFARLASRPYVFTIPRSSRPEFEKTLFDLRDRRLMRFSANQVRAISAATAGGGRFLAERDDTGTWYLVGDDASRRPLRSVTVDAAVQNLSVLRGQQFFDTPGAIGSLELTEPDLTVSVELRDGSTQTAVFDLAGNLAYGRRLPDGPVAEVRAVDTMLLHGFVETPPLAPGGEGAAGD